MDKPVGLTKDAGWELGVQRTVRAPPDVVWRYLLKDGARTWLGVGVAPTRVGEHYESTDGTVGELRSITENKRIRLTWHPRRWLHDSTLQITVTEVATGTTIGIHQERLLNPDERSQMILFWEHVMWLIESDLMPV